MIKTMFLCFALLVAVPVLAQQPGDFQSSTYGFSLKYPATYKQMDPQGQMREAVVLSSIAEEWVSKTTFDVEVTPNVNDLAAFCKNYESIWDGIAAFTDLKIISRSDSVFKGIPCIVYTCTAYVPENKKTIEWRSIFFLRGGRAYKVTLSSFPDRFATTLEETRMIFDTFRFD